MAGEGVVGVSPGDGAVACPWLPAPREDPPVTCGPGRAPRWAAGAEVDPPRALGTAAADGGGLWVVGAHGGAGATVLGARDAGTSWPVPGPGGEVQVLVAARTSARGIAAARAAAVQWASGSLPGVVLVGVAWVADAPGRLPRPLRDSLALARGAFPMSVSVPWVGAWRTSEVADATKLPRDVRRALEACRLPERNPS